MNCIIRSFYRRAYRPHGRMEAVTNAWDNAECVATASVDTGLIFHG